MVGSMECCWVDGEVRILPNLFSSLFRLSRGHRADLSFPPADLLYLSDSMPPFTLKPFSEGSLLLAAFEGTSPHRVSFRPPSLSRLFDRSTLHSPLTIIGSRATLHHQPRTRSSEWSDKIVSITQRVGAFVLVRPRC